MIDDLVRLICLLIVLAFGFFALRYASKEQRIKKERDCRNYHSRISKLFFNRKTIAFDSGYDSQAKMLWINSAIQDAGKDFILSRSEWKNLISVDDKIKSFILKKYFNDDFLFRYDLGSYAVPKKSKIQSKNEKLISLFEISYFFIIFYMQTIALYAEEDDHASRIVWGIEVDRNEEDYVFLKMLYAALYVLSIVGCNKADIYSEMQVIERTLGELNAD